MLKKLLKKTASELDRQKIPYMVIGGQAILVYGEPRLTKVIDITLGLDVDELDRMVEIAGKLQLKLLTKDPREFAKKTYVLPVSDETSKARVDFVFSFSPYERQAIKRTNRVKVDDVQVDFAAVEDVILHKLVAGRPRDIEDVSSILLKKHKMNEKYLLNVLKMVSASLDKDLTAEYQRLKHELTGGKS